MGVLAGDALLNFAFETVADAMVRSAGDMRVAKAFAVLAKKTVSAIGRNILPSMPTSVISGM